MVSDLESSPGCTHCLQVDLQMQRIAYRLVICLRGYRLEVTARVAGWFVGGHVLKHEFTVSFNEIPPTRVDLFKVRVARVP